MHFVSFSLYLYFFEILGDKEISLVFKPMVVASIFFYYLFSSENIKSVYHYIILGLIFFADNIELLEETVFYQFGLTLHFITLCVLLYLIFRDTQLIKNDSKLDQYLGLIFLVFIICYILLKIISEFFIKSKFSSFYFVANYIAIFILVFVFAIYNFFKHKTKSSKFLVLCMLILFLSDLFFVINRYYYPNKILVVLSCLTELPTYYLLILYFINRDRERTKIEIIP